MRRLGHTDTLVDGRNNQQTSSIVQKETAEVNAEENETPIESTEGGSPIRLAPSQSERRASEATNL